jgi:recombinase-like zinc beta ribbon protein
VRVPKTGGRVFRTREGEKPVLGADATQLHIIPDELRALVQARQEFVKRVYEAAGKRPGLLRSSAMNSPYLFSGLLKCAVCRANLQIVSGRGRNHKHQTYSCPMNFQRGDSVCANRVRVHCEVLERELLAGLQAKVLREEVVDYVLDRFEQELVKELENIGGEMDAMRRGKADLEVEIRRRTAGLASGIHSPAVMSEIADREREVSEISDRLVSARPESVRSKIKNLRDQAMTRIRDLRGYVNTDTQAARVPQAKHIEQIVMEPDGQTYVASGKWNLLAEVRWDGAEGQNRTAYAGLFRAALYR